MTPQTIAEVLAQGADWGVDAVSWWATDATPSAEDTLRGRGAEIVETVEVLARELTRDEGDHVGHLASDVSVELVQDAVTLQAATHVRTVGWGQPVADRSQLAADLHRTRAALESWSEFKVVATLDGEPIATGGCEIADRVARLWGAVTLPQWRHRGAYRAVLDERLRLAARHDADMALVKGRVQTSGPILARAGFASYGRERRYRLAVEDAPGAGRGRGATRPRGI